MRRRGRRVSVLEHLEHLEFRRVASLDAVGLRVRPPFLDRGVLLHVGVIYQRLPNLMIRGKNRHLRGGFEVQAAELSAEQNCFSVFACACPCPAGMLCTVPGGSRRVNVLPSCWDPGGLGSQLPTSVVHVTLLMVTE